VLPVAPVDESVGWAGDLHPRLSNLLGTPKKKWRRFVGAIVREVGLVTAD
jgi:hypothetical protein